MFKYATVLSVAIMREVFYCASTVTKEFVLQDPDHHPAAHVHVYRSCNGKGAHCERDRNPELQVALKAKQIFSCRDPSLAYKPCATIKLEKSAKYCFFLFVEKVLPGSI